MNAPLRSIDEAYGSDPHAAIEALFAAHADFVVRTLRHLGVPPSALDDATQDVFVTAFRRWHSFEGRASARTWLFGIARRIAARHRDRTQRATRRAGTLTPAQEARRGADPYARHDAAATVWSLLRQLDVDKRAVFVLSEIEGMTAPEVADALSIPLGTAYSRLRAAWKRLGDAAGRDRARVEALLAAAGQSRLDDDRRARMWAAIAIALPRLTATALGVTSVATAGVAKWMVIVGGLALGLAGARALVAEDPTATTEDPIPPGMRHAEAAAAARSRAAVSPTLVDPDPASDSPAPALVPDTDAPSPALTSPSPTSAPIPSRRSPAPDTEPALRVDGPDLAAELALVRAAQTALAAGDTATAFDELAAHARNFPRGQLRTERETTRVRALCKTGRRAEAQPIARALGRTLQELCGD